MKRSFFLVVLCGVGFLNCKSSREPQADQDSILRAEQRERDFMQRQAEYVKEHGHSKHYNLQDGKVYEWKLESPILLLFFLAHGFVCKWENRMALLHKDFVSFWFK
mgnify:FL=1